MKVTKALKLMALFLSILMLFASLSACKAKEATVESTKQTDTKADQTSGTETKAEDPYGKYDPTITINTVRMLGDDVKFEPGNADNHSIEKNIWARVYEERLGIKFNYKWTTPLDSGQYQNRWNLAIASRDLPDMAQVTLETFHVLAEADMLHDMTDLFEDYASPLYKQANQDD